MRTTGLIVLLAWLAMATAEAAVHYDVAWEGVEDEAMLKDLGAVSNTSGAIERPPATLYLLRRRAKDDISIFDQYLRSRGFYGAKIDFEISEKQTPVLVTFRIHPGPPYRFQSAEIITPESYPELQKKLPSAAKLGLKSGQPARARTIIDAQNNLIHAMRKQGYPFAKIAERRVVVDHGSQEVRVTFRSDPGPLGRFGSTSIQGLESVDEVYLQRKIPWRKGDRFNEDLFTEAQKRFTDTGLFTLVRITHAESLEQEGMLPVSIEVKERKHRTILAGLNYQTDEGPGAKVSWEHRNFFHKGERLKIEATASGITYAGEASFQKPEFLARNQSLQTSLRLARDDTDAYTSRNVESSLLVKREILKGMLLSTGPAFRFSQVESQALVVPENDSENFALLSLPSQLEWDTSDNLLDPTRGGRLSARFTPFFDTLSADTTFVKAYANYSRYFKLLQKPFLLFAGRAAVGSLVGTERDDIPADARFYAGGGGSIRGYSFQTVGPLLGEDPLGGRSLIEFSAEFRMKVTKTIGFVTFLDGGSVFQSTYPDFSETLRWGAGAGLRYYTPIGPLRLDVAVPLNPRDGIDDPFQVYMSLGQAF